MTKLAFNPKDGDEKMQYDADLQNYMCCQQAWAFTDKLAAQPCCGMPMFLTGVSGLIWVTFIEIRIVVELGYTMDTLGKCLENQPKEFIGRLFSMLLAPGDSVYCPRGQIPITLAIGPEHDKDSESKLWYGSFLVSPILDTLKLHDTAPKVLGELSAWLTKAISRGLMVFKLNGPLISKWTDSWKPKATEPAAAPPAALDEATAAAEED